VKVLWFDLYNYKKGENEAEAFEMPQTSASHMT